MLEIIGAALKIIGMLIGKWFELSNEKKQVAKEILEEVPHATDASHITSIFDRINRL